jgi:C4-dicarboxylate-specific signal transduction histidine kinase
MGDDVEILVVSKSPAAVIEADPGQLDQIVVNLAVNARDAMPHGGKFILETRATRFDEAFAEQHQNMAAGKYVVLAVSDTGTGMDEATVSRVFEPFFTTKEMALSSKAQATSWSTVSRDTERPSRYISPPRITKSGSNPTLKWRP